MRKAEAIIRDRLAELLGIPLESREIKLAAGASVHVDAVSADGTVLAEFFARQGELKGASRRRWLRTRAEALRLRLLRALGTEVARGPVHPRQD